MNIKFGRSDIQFTLGILASLLIFYPKFFVAQSGFLVADHLWQHYPWADLLWKSVHQFKLPFWTPLIQCGFPIAAESQIGVFYPINLLLYFLLPIQWAHSYMNLIHFLLSGLGMYFYARQIGLKPVGSFIAAFLFLFGASYGGAYYSITSLKTIAWFPWGLFLFEKVYQEWKRHYFIYLSFVFAFSLIAGYMQIGILCLFMFAIYALLRVFLFPEQGKNNFNFWVKMGLGLTAAGLFAILLALPQMWLTFKLAMLSNREGLVEEYAYVGSMFPGAVVTTFFPHWNNIFRGNSFYMGIFSVLLIFAAFDQPDVSLKRFLKLWCWIAVISLLMALGQWSPLYIAFVKITHFYSFRTPAKFIIFVCFSLALLGGFGFQRLWDLAKSKQQSPQIAQIGQRFLAVCLFFIGSAGFIFSIFKFGKTYVLKVGDWFITSFVYQKVGHPHTFEKYQEKFERSIDYILALFSFHPWTIWNSAMILTGIVFSVWLIKLKKGLRLWLVLGFIFLFVDLYGFASIMFKKGFDDYRNLEIKSPIVQYLVHANEKGQVSRVYSFNYQFKLVPAMPSLNMLYGYADIGAYSPFVLKRYYETIGLMGNVNDSNFPYWPTPEFVTSHLNLLKLTGVSHILSLYKFDHPELELLTEDPKNNVFLFRFKKEQSKTFFVPNLKIADNWEAVKKIILDPKFDPFSAMVVERSELPKLAGFLSEFKRGFESYGEFKITSEVAEPEFERWQVNATRPGYFVVANSYYPGWKAWVNGKQVQILKAYGLFQAVPIAEPNNTIEFRFSPFGE